MSVGSQDLEALDTDYNNFRSLMLRQGPLQLLMLCLCVPKLSMQEPGMLSRGYWDTRDYAPRDRLMRPPYVKASNGKLRGIKDKIG